MRPRSYLYAGILFTVIGLSGLAGVFAYSNPSVSFLSSIFGVFGQKREDANPGPTAGLTKEQAIKDAQKWASGWPGRDWCEVNPTGSMVPTFDSRAILLLEIPVSWTFAKGQIVLRAVSDGSTVSHRITDVRDGAVYLDGDNNKYPDGWFPFSLIKYRVAGILYFSNP
jgi:hypothetical protein